MDRINGRPVIWSPTLGQIALVGAIVLIVWALSHVVLIIFFRVLLALALRGTAEWLAERTRTSPRLMLGLVSVAVFLAAAGLTYWIGPRLAAQAQDLLTRLGQQIDFLRSHFGNSPIGQHLDDRLSSVWQRLFGVSETALSASFSFTVDLIVIIVTGLYLAISPELYVRGVLHMIPTRKRERSLQVMRELGRVLRLWLLGQLVDMATVAVLIAVGLSLLGAPVPYALATLGGILTFIPYFGAVAAGIPAVLVAMTVSWATVLWTVVIFTGCHLIEGYLVGPLVQRRLIQLPPALIILGMTIAGTLFGALGVVLGTPLAASILVLLDEFYVKDTLGDYHEKAET